MAKIIREGATTVRLVDVGLVRAGDTLRVTHPDGDVLEGTVVVDEADGRFYLDAGTGRVDFPSDAAWDAELVARAP